MNDLTLIQKIITWGVPILFAITVHEVAHGWVASKLGDQTAKQLGRLTLNPIKHIDVVGTLIVPGILLYLGGVIFGWAKPVPVNWKNLRNPTWDTALVAVAGPLTNFLMAIGWAIVLGLSINLVDAQSTTGFFLFHMCRAGVIINLVLMVLNLIPIPPLDGSRVLSAFLPYRLGYYYNYLEPYGIIIVLILLFTGVLGAILLPSVQYLYTVMMQLLVLG